MVASSPVSAITTGGLGLGNRQNSLWVDEAVRRADGCDKDGPRPRIHHPGTSNWEVHPAACRRPSEAWELISSRDRMDI